jgi:hypothetical protein
MFGLSNAYANQKLLDTVVLLWDSPCDETTILQIKDILKNDPTVDVNYTGGNGRVFSSLIAYTGSCGLSLIDDFLSRAELDLNYRDPLTGGLLKTTMMYAFVTNELDATMEILKKLASDPRIKSEICDEGFLHLRTAYPPAPGITCGFAKCIEIAKKSDVILNSSRTCGKP